MFDRVISGFQTRADQGGIRAPHALGVPSGGRIAWRLPDRDRILALVRRNIRVVAMSGGGSLKLTPADARDSDATI